MEIVSIARYLLQIISGLYLGYAIYKIQKFFYGNS